LEEIIYYEFPNNYFSELVSEVNSMSSK
jgi:hypothetical protein